MLGLLALGLTAIMIYTLVKNALVGKQLDRDDTFLGTTEIIIPVTSQSKMFLTPWSSNIELIHAIPGHLRIHFLVDGEHDLTSELKKLKEKFSFVEIHEFQNRPSGSEAATWLIDQAKTLISAQVVIIGDAELVPSEAAILSLSKLVTDKQKPIYVLPQTAKLNVLGEAIAVLNPTLALASVFGFRKIRKNISHPLMGLSYGWMGMTLFDFQALELTQIRGTSWKQIISKRWDLDHKNFLLGFGEGHLLKYYPSKIEDQLKEMKDYWKELFKEADRTALWLYLVTVFLWSFPILCFVTHPFWSLASFALLILYRFFSKIVFQESWTSTFLHFLGALAWVGTLGWYGVETLKAKYASKV